MKSPLAECLWPGSFSISTFSEVREVRTPHSQRTLQMWDFLQTSKPACFLSGDDFPPISHESDVSGHK